MLGLGLIMTAAWCATSLATAVEKKLDVGLTWSVHRTAEPQLYTRGGYQYVAYYDDERQLRLAQRELGSDEWTERRFPVRTRWAHGGHARVTLAVDVNGHVHLAAYRRDLSEQPPSPPGSIYFRSKKPHDPQSMERMPMVDAQEPSPHYPRFIEDAEERLYIQYRVGMSGSGLWRWNAYDAERQTWRTMPVLLDGEGERGAYGGPVLGPDGRWHCMWVWRETADASTTHTVNYMVGDDLLNWETAGGEPVELPATVSDTQAVVDPVGMRLGLVNSRTELGWDSQDRPIISYHKYDNEGDSEIYDTFSGQGMISKTMHEARGMSQIYNARYENGRWRIVQATDWDFRWHFQGGGALVGSAVNLSAPEPAGEGVLHQRVWSAKHGWQRLTLDEKTLEPIEAHDIAELDDPADGLQTWQRRRSVPESDFDVRPMRVTWIADNGKGDRNGPEYWLRWEHGPGNNDRPVDKPWPDATMLRLYKVAP